MNQDPQSDDSKALSEVETALDRANGLPIEQLEEKQPEHQEEDIGPEVRTRGMFGLRVLVADDKHGIRRGFLPAGHYLKTLQAWRLRKALGARRPLAIDSNELGELAPTAPLPSSWIPIGPTVIRRGQAYGNPAVSGRAVDIAIATGGLTAYVATANGGVWRSDDGGRSWRPLMDGFDLNPTVNNTDSLACGAVAIDSASPDRVYVGTGEGETWVFFRMVLGTASSYAGVGPLRSDDGGRNWIREPVFGSPGLEGEAFFQLAVDPHDRERVLAATTQGIYRREPDGAGGYRWVRWQTGVCSSVVAASAASTTTWFAAIEGGTMLTSTDGAAWQPLGSDYPPPTSVPPVKRVSLAVQPTNPMVVYALSSVGVHRLDVGVPSWKRVASGPIVGQSDYMMSIVVDPMDVNRLYLGGVTMKRAVVGSAGSGSGVTYSLSDVTEIGSDVHCDNHRLVVQPGSGDELWVATDGGVFKTSAASTTATFDACNSGLATALCTRFDHHPTEVAVIFCGTQDNGTLRYTGEEAWLCSAEGDGSANVVNWAAPFDVIRALNFGALYRTVDGGRGPGSWNSVRVQDSHGLSYPPLAGAPLNMTAPAEANILAVGSDRTYFSSDFGTTWSSPDPAPLSDKVAAIAFAKAHLAYSGTIDGRVYRYRRTGSTWGAGTSLGQVGGGSAGLAPVVTDLIVDPADTTGESFYVCLGGLGDWRRIWHFDGASSVWEQRSGPAEDAMTSVLNVHFSALEVDPANPSHLYAGADIGIWRSLDGGATWVPYADGLPDAGVVDLKLHPKSRLLRAATYGRGVFERDVDATNALGVELYVRDTTLDLARATTIDWLDNPEDPSDKVRHWAGPNIKVDPPSSAGTYQTPTTRIDFFEFVDQIVDGSDGVATVDPSSGTAINRVYVEVHNRGMQSADNVKVMLLLTNASAGLPTLPPGYTADVQSGTAINTSVWKTVGIRVVNGLRVGVPQIVEFDLPSSMLPPPTSLPGQSHYCLLALVDSPDDRFTNTQLIVDALSITERKAAQRNLQIVEFTGTLPSEQASVPPAALVWTMATLQRGDRANDLLFDLRGARGSVAMVLPRTFAREPADFRIVGGHLLEAGYFDEQLHRHRASLARLLDQSRFDANWTKLAAAALEEFVGGPAIRFEPPEMVARGSLRALRNLAAPRVLLAFEPPKDFSVGDQWDMHLIQVEPEHRTFIGGSTYRCRVALLPDDEREIRLKVTREIREDATLLEIRPHENSSGSKPFCGSESENVQVVEFSTSGPRLPRSLEWDAGRKAYWLEIPRLGARAGIRRVTVVARAGGFEGRKTINVSP